MGLSFSVEEIEKRVDRLLERERTFREEFSHRLMTEMRAYIDQRLRYAIPQFYDPDGRIFVHTNDGHRIFLDAREEFMALHVMEHGEWETHVRAVMRRILHPGGIFVDIGANIGLHTLLGAALVGEKGHVYAIEAHPRTFSFLDRNIEINGLNKRVMKLCLAASDVADQDVSFEYFPQHPGMSGFRLPECRVAELHATPEKINVKTTTLDALLSPSYRADLIKIDVEGFELVALKGARDLLSRNKDACFLIEYDLEVSSSVLGSEAPRELLEIFQGNGYLAFVVMHDGDPVQADYASLIKLVREDILFIHPSSRYISQFM